MAHIRKRPATTRPDGSERSPVRYVVRYKVDGKWHGKTFRRKEDAERYKVTQEADLARGDWLDPRLNRTLFAEVAEDWLKTKLNCKERTRVGYAQLLRNHVLPHFGKIPVGRITTTKVRQFISEMESAGAGAGTIRNAYRNVLKPILDTAVEQSLIRSNPASPAANKIKLPRTQGPPRDKLPVLTAEQVEALAREVTPHYAVLIRFAAYTGLRAGEVAALRVKNVDLFRRRVTVRESVTLVSPIIYSTPKTKSSERTVPLPPSLVEPLTSLMAGRSPEDFVFRSPRKSRLIYGTFYSSHFRPAVRRALPPQLHGLRFHDLRHTYASLLINELNANPKVVQERMGHSSITVTFDRYGHLFPGLDEALTDKLDAVIRSAGEVTPPKGDVASF